MRILDALPPRLGRVLSVIRLMCLLCLERVL
jgi:hypothetical protein